MRTTRFALNAFSSHSLMLAALLIGYLPQTATPAQPPNILIIMADDCTYNDLPLYGGQNAITPHIDRLASQGLTFTSAYLTTANVPAVPG